MGLVANALTNESAMETLHYGFGGSPARRFLPTHGASSRTFTTEVLPGVMIHVLGPSRDENVIRDMDPPSGQSYISQLTRQPSEDTPPPPFPSPADWILATSAIPSYLKLDTNEEGFIKQLGEGLEESVTVALDSAVNGTSLMLILQFGKAILLFPGDSQWGTWEVAMKDPEWRGLLEKTTFYKVGHHGSHNATPVEFIDQLLKDGNALWGAMVSVKPVDKWPSIPRIPLLQKLKERARTGVVRSDALNEEVPNGCLY
jgi:hypothetical protein